MWILLTLAACVFAYAGKHPDTFGLAHDDSFLMYVIAVVFVLWAIMAAITASVRKW